MIRLLFFLMCILLAASVRAESTKILDVYDHEMHEKKVFAANKIECSYCHNFEVNKATRLGALKPEIASSTFNKPIKELCHSCHRNPDTTTGAPQTCYTCHRSVEKMKDIKPQSHRNVDWVKNHSLNARTADNACTTCHSNSQCVKCHVERNNLFQNNHSRNFRYYHSIEARASPQKCDACHSRVYCMSCHLRGHP